MYGSVPVWHSATLFWSKRERIYECASAKLHLLGASDLLCVDYGVQYKFLMVRLLPHIL